MLFKEELTIAFLNALFRPPSQFTTHVQYSLRHITSLYEEGVFKSDQKTDVG